MSLGTAETKFTATGVAAMVAPTWKLADALTAADAPVTVAVAVTVAAPAPLPADFRLTVATPFESVKAVAEVGEMVARLLLTVNVTISFAAAPPELFFSLAVTVNEPEPLIVFDATPLELVKATAIVPPDVDEQLSPAAQSVDPAEPPPPPQATISMARAPNTTKTVSFRHDCLIESSFIVMS
ncbi:MAG: hypothetical protein VB032_05965 [Burkholderiaceae bacterium]|nr:hypothetical protein [Burkholderiaceae bacterium]